MIAKRNYTFTLSYNIKIDFEMWSTYAWQSTYGHWPSWLA